MMRFASVSKRFAPLSNLRYLSSAKNRVALPDLPYDYSELEPTLSAELMELHHSKHHAAYVNNFNAAVEQLEAAEAAGDVPKQIQLQAAIRFNGGGHVNHSIFWTNLSPTSKDGGGEPTGKIATAINNDFGSFDKFKEKFMALANTTQGSGWCWLTFNPGTSRIQLVNMPNQDPVSMLGLVPLLGVDLWEHGYYLVYKNARPDYLKSIWNIINWKNVEERYLNAITK